MADSIVRLKVESSEYDQKLKRAAEGLQRYSDKCREVGGTLEVVEKDTLEYVRALGQMETTSKTATGKLAEMKNAFVELSSVYRNMTDQEKASPVGKALSESLDQLKVRINQSKSQLADINAEIGETGRVSSDADMSLKGLASAFGLNATKLTVLGSALAVAKGSFELFNDVLHANREMTDNVGRDIEGLKSIYTGFLNALNNSDISGFLSRIQDIMNAARNAYDSISELQEFNAFNRINVQKARTGLNEAITDYRGGNATKQQVMNANDVLKNELRERMSREKAVYDEQVKKVAKEFGANSDDLKNLLSGKYVDWQNAKHSNLPQKMGDISQPFGVASSQFHFPLKRGPQTDDERLSNLARTIPLERLDSLQQLGQQAAATETEIAQLDKTLSRMLNRKESPGSVIPRAKGIKPDKTEDFNQKVMNQWLAASAKSELNAGSLMPTDSGPSEIWQKITQGAKESESSIQDLTRAFEQLNQSEGVIGKTADKTAKGTANSWSLAASSVSAMGSALQSIDDPGAKIMGIIGQAIANIALGFAQASAAPATTAAGIWGWIAAAVGGTATMISTIAAIHSATGYSEGGEIKGRTFSGDQIPAMLNAGEIVLNRAQAGNLASQLQGGGMSNVNWQIRIKGEDIYLSASTSQQRRGRGRIVTSNRQRN